MATLHPRFIVASFGEITSRVQPLLEIGYTVKSMQVEPVSWSSLTAVDGQNKGRIAVYLEPRVGTPTPKGRTGPA